MNIPPDLARVARRVVWWKEPAQTLADPVFFLAHLMTHGGTEDVRVARRHFTAAQFRAALAAAPPGVFDARSWAYWHTLYGDAPPPLPRRRFTQPGDTAAITHDI